MERGIETGFKDKNKRPIHIDDVVQHRLGKFGKASGGPRNQRVIDFKGKPQLVAEYEIETKYGGHSLTEHACNYLVVFRCNHIPG